MENELESSVRDLLGGLPGRELKEKIIESKNVKNTLIEYSLYTTCQSLHD